MISLSNPIAFHARRTPERFAITFRGVDISYADFDQRIRRVADWLAAQGIGADDVLRAELEAMK
jgi:fatty-acyl-CoA synthase